MKRLLLSAICSFIASAAIATTVSGNISNTNAQPIVNQVVYAEDTTSNQWMDSALTDASGNYSIAVPAWVTNCGMLVHTSDFCNAGYQSQGFAYTGSDITADFVLCYLAPPPATIGGTITSSNPAQGDTATVVYLVDQSYDSVALTYILTAVDSTITDHIGQYGFHLPASYGTLLVKAALPPSSPDYAGYLPTYYTSSLNWSGATAIVPNSTVDIQLIAGVNPGGPGFIGGDVLQGANKSTAVGDPLNKRVLILTTQANVPVAYTYSNASGQFSFPSVPFGTYKIFGDVMGKANPPLTITLSSQAPSISNIVFEEHSHIFDGHIATTVANVNGKLSGISLFPNPAIDNINILGLETVSGVKTVTLGSMSGATVYSHTFANGEKAVVPVNALSKGVYMLNVSTIEGLATFKVTK